MFILLIIQESSHANPLETSVINLAEYNGDQASAMSVSYRASVNLCTKFLVKPLHLPVLLNSTCLHCGLSIKTDLKLTALGIF